MPDENFKVILEQFMRHIDSRLDKIDAALSISAIDNKSHSNSIAKHEVQIEQNKKDIDSVSEKFRRDLESINENLKKNLETLSETTLERETTCSNHNTNQHKSLFDKTDNLEKEMSEIRGALKLIQILIVPIFIGVIVAVIKGFM